MPLENQPLFADLELVKRIERCEARLLAAVVSGCGGDAFAVPVGSGYALFSGVDSPFTKLAGFGFEALELDELRQLEQRYHTLGAPVQFELATLAAAELTNVLARRGYRLSGFENVLARPLAAALPPSPAPDFVVRHTKPSELEAWIDVMVQASLQLAGSETAAAHDSFDSATLETAYRDMVRCSEVQCWTAERAGTIAGGAVMSIRDGVLQLGGAATHPKHRRRGIQRALLAARLTEGRALGCDMAVVATQPGSQSQHNVQRCGFSLLYARAIWQLHPQSRG